MEAVVRGVFIYGFLLLLFRAAGKRSLGQMDTFDLVLLLIISEATQNSLVGQNYSVTYAALLIVTLVGCEVLMSKLKQRRPGVETWSNGGPLILIDRGELLKDRMDRAGVGLDDIMVAARQSQGLERLEQVKYAVLERSGEISVIPKDDKEQHTAA